MAQTRFAGHFNRLEISTPGTRCRKSARICASGVGTRVGKPICFWALDTEGAVMPSLRAISLCRTPFLVKARICFFSALVRCPRFIFFLLAFGLGFPEHTQDELRACAKTFGQLRKFQPVLRFQNDYFLAVGFAEF